MSDAMNPPGDTDNQEAHPMDTLNDHAAAIRANLTAIKQYAHNGDVPRYAHIAEAGKHADALAAELDEANARAARLRKYSEVLENEVQMRVASYIVVDFSGAREDAGIQPGDLDTAPGDTADGRLMDRRNRPDV